MKCVLLAFATLALPPVFPQDAPLAPPAPPPRYVEIAPPPPDDTDFKVSSDVEVVLLDVSVRNEAGGYASGLTRDQFTVLENGKPQPITAFGAQDVPVTVGLVVDYSGSVRPKRGEVVTAAMAFAQESHPQDEFFVVNFNDSVRLGLPEGTKFTDDHQLLRSSLLLEPMRGRTMLNDALRKALQHIVDGRMEKKTLLLISDGGDNASETTDEEVFRLAREHSVTIYTIGIFNPDDKDKNPGFLKKLASITGGEAFMPSQISELPEVCRKIARDIRNRYSIAYVPIDRNFDGRIRKIRVNAVDPARGRLIARTRTEYLASRGNDLPQSAKSERK